MTRRTPLLGLSLGYFMVLLDTTALTVALPSLARDLGAGVEGLAWITDAYTLTFAGGLLAGGVIADRRGADRTFMAGLAGFVVLSLACAAAPSAAWLVAARALLGVAGALLLPASLALVAATETDPTRRSRAIAAWAAISAAALAAGPVLGGVLVAAAGWRAIFVLNAPVGLAAALLLRGRMPAVPRRSARVAPLGQAAVLVAVTAITWALIRGGTADVAGGLAVAALAALVAARAEPAVPPELLRRAAYRGALGGGLVVGAALAGELFLMTLELQRARGLGPIATGAAFLPLTVPMIVNPPLVARLIARVGPCRPVLAGLALLAAAATALAAVPDDASYLLIGLGLALFGCGVSLTLPALTSAAVLAAPPDAAGAAGGLFSVARQGGATLGVAAAAATGGGAAGQLTFAGAALAAATAWTADAWRRRAPGGCQRINDSRH
jgi:DHA2 family methylenomycin A resistance protein-like MFS transporter